MTDYCAQEQWRLFTALTETSIEQNKRTVRSTANKNGLQVKQSISQLSHRAYAIRCCRCAYDKQWRGTFSFEEVLIDPCGQRHARNTCVQTATRIKHVCPDRDTHKTRVSRQRHAWNTCVQTATRIKHACPDSVTQKNVWLSNFEESSFNFQEKSYKPTLSRFAKKQYVDSFLSAQTGF